MKVYVASSWKNTRQPAVVAALRAAGYAVYDFGNPTLGQPSFSWAEIDSDGESWSPELFRRGLDHLAAKRGFALDIGALSGADAAVMVLPCGRSAHLGLGYAVAAGPAYIYPLRFRFGLPRSHVQQDCLELSELVEELHAADE